MDTDEKFHGQHRAMIESVAIMSEVEIRMTICTINKLGGNNKCFIQFKIYMYMI